MNKYYTFLIVLLFSFGLGAQAIYKTIESEKLQESRELKIQLPRNYDPENKRTYPLVVVLDGDYLFEPVAGNIDYQAYWEDIPDCIVVGINQSNTREDDFYYDEDSFLPVEDGAAFYEFLASELIQFIEKEYNTSNFRIIIGHDLSANFLNYFLFKDKPLFRSYVALSPDLAPEMTTRLNDRLTDIEQKTFYYLATADADISFLKQSINESDSKLKLITNENLSYNFDSFEDANHYSLVGRGIPKALNHIFSLYKPINGKEYKEKIIPYEGSPYEYLVKKYEDIEFFYGFEKKLIENDIRAIAAACNKRDDLESLDNLAKLVKKEFPNSMLSAYYMGMVNEKEGNYKKALLRYKAGLLMEPSQYIDKEIMLEKMYEAQDALKK
ncbi:alpha/beta hydrolase [Winogradskyella poriferorum]|uniref:alpha/beta hydrolase n=1 Tax=Winogradskyella poriferorum TaxID=307627 RepID=UPI003D64DAC5